MSSNSWGTFMMLDSKSQQVGKVSNVPMLEIEPGQRLSYHRLYTDGKEMPAEVHLHHKFYDVVILSEKVIGGAWFNSISIVGTAVCAIVEEAHKYDHIFGAKDLSTTALMKLLGLPVLDGTLSLKMTPEDRALLDRESFRRVSVGFYPELPSFYQRIKFFLGWLFTGETEKTDMKAGVTFVSASNSFKEDDSKKESQEKDKPTKGVEKKKKKKARHPKPRRSIRK